MGFHGCWRQPRGDRVGGGAATGVAANRTPIRTLCSKVRSLCTRGDVTIVIDSKVVVQGIRRGPSYRHRKNAFQWKAFWEAAGNRTVHPIKIKSHLDRAEALQRGVPELHWVANSRADAHAEEAAAEAQLPPAAVAEVQRVDMKALHVQQHLTVVAFSVAKEATALYGPSSHLQRAAAARERALERKGRLEVALSTTAHLWSQEQGRCLTCL